MAQLGNARLINRRGMVKVEYDASALTTIWRNLLHLRPLSIMYSTTATSAATSTRALVIGARMSPVLPLHFPFLFLFSLLTRTYVEFK